MKLSPACLPFNTEQNTILLRIIDLIWYVTSRRGTASPYSVNSVCSDGADGVGGYDSIEARDRDVSTVGGMARGRLHLRHYSKLLLMTAQILLLGYNVKVRNRGAPRFFRGRRPELNGASAI